MVVHKKINLKEKITEDYLDLSLCNLEKIPIKEILEFPKIKRLNLSFNNLSNLPSDISKLQHIKEIDLSKNHLQSLPENIGSLVNLKCLDLLGNQLKSLPESFSELKSLQWLDLKDNPLDSELKKVAGECNDEAQCKKCAINVVRYMKQVAAEEERKRQIEIRRKKEKEAKQQAEELAKEKEIKLQKKREREQKKLQKKQTNEENLEHEGFNENLNTSSCLNSPNKHVKSGGCQTFLSTLSFLFFVTLIICGTYFVLVNYCESGNKLRIRIKNYSKANYLSHLIQMLDQNVCPVINQNKVPYQNFIKLFQQINL
ncbi:leucine-rich repeat-containing 59 [Brachionus plicatilis]|uniref:Leucine-rich repeat-containing 59 n=1 Tax=Brachionus plicatilis TaxID=10195 RepID=A0A3M7RYL4_BRAPC|nr:leucine-rich repeat-containing 59 [Brachionus plicatilis]